MLCPHDASFLVNVFFNLTKTRNISIMISSATSLGILQPHKEAAQSCLFVWKCPVTVWWGILSKNKTKTHSNNDTCTSFRLVETLLFKLWHSRWKCFNFSEMSVAHYTHSLSVCSRDLPEWSSVIGNCATHSPFMIIIIKTIHLIYIPFLLIMLKTCKLYKGLNKKRNKTNFKWLKQNN